jgi:predicted metal-dependent hydrolase
MSERLPGKPARPRDELGRPLPRDAESRLRLEDFDALSVDENHRLGVEHFNAGRFFPAHEAWETAWKQRKDSDEAEFFKGLSQLGAGYVHFLRGNRHGAFTLLRRGAGRIAAYEDGHRGVPTERLAEIARAQADAIERGDLTPPDGLEAPAI